MILIVITSMYLKLNKYFQYNLKQEMLFILFQVNINGEWVPWSAKVPQIEVETHKVAAPDIVVPTLDTVRHESLLYTWLAEHKPIGETVYLLIY